MAEDCSSGGKQPSFYEVLNCFPSSTTQQISAGNFFLLFEAIALIPLSASFLLLMDRISTPGVATPP